MTNYVKEFQEITKQMSETYERKNTDYGNSFAVSVQKYGLIAALTRISDKFNRMENLILTRNQQVNDESLSDFRWKVCGDYEYDVYYVYK